MKFLRVIATADRRTGGPIEGLFQSSRELASLGHSTEIATLDSPTNDCVLDSPFPTHALGPRMQTYGYAPRFSPWIRANRSRFDAVIVHGVWNYTSVGAWRALSGGPTPYFVFTHGGLDPWHRRAYPVKDLAKQLFWLTLEGRVLQDAASVLFTSEEERQLARTAYWGRQSFRDRVVAYGTADVGGDAGKQVAAFRETVGVGPNRKFLLFLSRIHPKKGTDLLVRGFAAIAGDYPDLDLVVAGPDQIGWTSELKRVAADHGIAGRVHWPDMLQGDAKWGAYRSAEAFVLPSHSENFGIVVAEAMACGVPVLITDRVNIWREVKNSRSGLVSKDTLDGVTEMLREFCQIDAKSRVEMGLNARNTFLQKFEIQAAARDLVSVAAQATSGRGIA